MLRKILGSALAALLAVAAMLPARSDASVLVSSFVGPPPALPVYDQPLAYAPNLLWQPGFWSYAATGYYWVPGMWVAPPQAGLLWTPGYWSWTPQGSAWNPGYWARTVGFYGGIDYGWGYFGQGYCGGRRFGNQFRYNTFVTHVNTAIVHNVYVDRSVVNKPAAVSAVSYYGRPHGAQLSPMAATAANAVESLPPSRAIAPPRVTTPPTAPRALPLPAERARVQTPTTTTTTTQRPPG